MVNEVKESILNIQHQLNEVKDLELWCGQTFIVEITIKHKILICIFLQEICAVMTAYYKPKQ